MYQHFQFHTIKDASGTITHEEMKPLVGAGLVEDAEGSGVAPPTPRNGADREAQELAPKSKFVTKHRTRKSEE